jgi:hypothetical protein
LRSQEEASLKVSFFCCFVLDFFWGVRGWDWGLNFTLAKQAAGILPHEPRLLSGKLFLLEPDMWEENNFLTKGKILHVLQQMDRVNEDCPRDRWHF